jgi:hypothetical protein
LATLGSELCSHGEQKPGDFFYVFVRAKTEFAMKEYKSNFSIVVRHLKVNPDNPKATKIASEVLRSSGNEGEAIATGLKQARAHFKKESGQ